ncbi:MAG: hypothetical protein ABR520_08710 [Mycobacteriales bacterium]|nr:hypothetical protein [Frankia sp.]
MRRWLRQSRYRLHAWADRVGATDDAAQRDRLSDQLTQRLLALGYRNLAAEKGALPPLADTEFRQFSQNGEDGILLFLFSVLGTTNRRAVEICAGDGIECNTANLIVNHGWEGLLFDGDPVLVARGQRFYARTPETRRLPPRFEHAWLTRDNVDGKIRAAGFAGDIDLLSLDLDGMDYWIWDAIDCVSPRVVVLEYNNRWSEEFSVTVPYTDAFVVADQRPQAAGYFGASLPAFASLGRRKGYRLIGANSLNTNAVFLRDDVGDPQFPEVSAAACLASPYARYQQRTKYPLIARLPVVEVPPA